MSLLRFELICSCLSFLKDVNGFLGLRRQVCFFAVGVKPRLRRRAFQRTGKARITRQLGWVKLGVAAICECQGSLVVNFYSNFGVTLRRGSDPWHDERVINIRLSELSFDLEFVTSHVKLKGWVRHCLPSWFVEKSLLLCLVD